MRTIAPPRAEGRHPREARPGPGASDEDDRLVRMLAQGEDDAWPALVERHLPAIIGFAWYFLGDRAEAEDVAQETFVRLLAKARTWRPGGPGLRSWLLRVAMNLCIDRARTPRPASLEDGPAGEEPAELIDGSLTLDRHRLVRTALDALPERQRLAVVLVYYQGCSDREAAELMSTSIEAVESLLARARRALRCRLEPVRSDLLGAS